jgi:protocatechuate 3,4-dioxygenase beta subunit
MHIGQRGLDSLERERNKNGIKGEKQALLNRPMARKSKLQETVRLPSLDRHSIKMVMKHKPTAFYIPLERRRFLKSLAAVSVGFTLPGYLAEALILTPQVTQGPYYPLAANIPLDKDADLIYLNDSLTAATGMVSYVSGRVLDSSGNPIRGALVELWHADNNGEYTYSANAARNPAADPNFAGFGQYLTGSDGAYMFRTIKAGLYRGRTRHFHFGITVPGQLERYTTQLFWNEVPKDANGHTWDTTNTNDSALNGITNADQRASVIKDYTLVEGTTSNEVQTAHDFVMGQIPVEPTYPNGGSLVLAGTLVSGPLGGNPRFKITVPAYQGYSYEIYGNPTLGALGWGALPFSLTQTGAIDRNIYAATAEGALDLFVESKSVKGFYFVSFRVPGANTGTP